LVDKTAIEQLITRVESLLGAAGLQATVHFAERMLKYDISAEQVTDVVLMGKVFRDTMTGATIYWKDGIAVVVENQRLLTTYTGAVKARWVEIPP
jgi:hypothetical protein